jgi:hypothetical protein
MPGPREGQSATKLFRERIFGVELSGVARISEAVAQGVGVPWLAGVDNRHETTRIRQPKQRQEQSATLLPNLLPNAVGQTGKETDVERSNTEEVPIERGFPGTGGTNRDGSGRIRKPLLYPAELRDRLCFQRHAGQAALGWADFPPKFHRGVPA